MRDRRSIDPDYIADLIRQAAMQEILPRFKALAPHDIHEKSANNPVTAADIETEKRLTRQLKFYCPSSIVIGEEASHTDNSLLAQLNQDSDIWFMDPVDGTSNFVRGSEIFGLMLAYFSDRKWQAGWIYFPIEKKMLFAIYGVGVYWCDKKLPLFSARHPSSLEAHNVALRGIISGIPKNPLWRGVHERGRNIYDIRPSARCAAYHYRLLALGDIDFLLSFETYPWDHAAGIAVIEELGGASCNARGESFVPAPLVPGDYVLTARSPDMLKQVREQLLPSQ